MLLSLKIENIAIIESADIEFDSGLNVLTGETGAGKSIIIDSINAVLGERTSRELIRTGAQSASVTALFSGVSKANRRETLGIRYRARRGREYTSSPHPRRGRQKYLPYKRCAD